MSSNKMRCWFQGVESERCASFSMARKAERPVYTTIESTLADGLAVPMVGYNAFATANPLIDKLVVVKEEWIAIAILKLIESEKCVVEGAGATGLAAILAGQLDELKGKRLVEWEVEELLVRIAIRRSFTVNQGSATTLRREH